MTATRRAWLEARRQGIGGSDAGVLLGCNPWSSLTKLYAEKIGALDPTPDTPRLRWGRRFESGILEEYADATGLDVVDGLEAVPERAHTFDAEVDGQAHVVPMLRHPDCTTMIGNVDGVALGRERGPGVPDAKTVERHVFRHWIADERPPLTYLVQLQHYMAITGTTWACIAAFTGLSDPLYVYEIDYDREFAERLMETSDTFWRRFVLRRQPPPPDKSEATAKALAALYPTDSGRVVELTGPAVEWARRYDELGEDLARLKAQRAGFRTLLAATIADGTFGRLPDGSGYSLRTGKNGRALRRLSAGTIKRGQS